MSGHFAMTATLRAAGLPAPDDPAVDYTDAGGRTGCGGLVAGGAAAERLVCGLEEVLRSTSIVAKRARWWVARDAHSADCKTWLATQCWRFLMDGDSEDVGPGGVDSRRQSACTRHLRSVISPRLWERTRPTHPSASTSRCGAACSGRALGLGLCPGRWGSARAGAFFRWLRSPPSASAPIGRGFSRRRRLARPRHSHSVCASRSSGCRQRCTTLLCGRRARRRGPTGCPTRPTPSWTMWHPQSSTPRAGHHAGAQGPRRLECLRHGVFLPKRAVEMERQMVAQAAASTRPLTWGSTSSKLIAGLENMALAEAAACLVSAAQLGFVADRLPSDAVLHIEGAALAYSMLAGATQFGCCFRRRRSHLTSGGC